MDNVVLFKRDDLKIIIDEIKATVRDELRGYVFEDIITVKEACSYLKIGNNAFWERVRKGQIPVELLHRNGGSIYLFRSELEKFVKKS